MLPGALDVASFNETRYLLPIQYAVESSFVDMVAGAYRNVIERKVWKLSRFCVDILYAVGRLVSRQVAFQEGSL